MSDALMTTFINKIQTSLHVLQEKPLRTPHCEHHEHTLTGIKLQNGIDTFCYCSSTTGAFYRFILVQLEGYDKKKCWQWDTFTLVPEVKATEYESNEN